MSKPLPLKVFKSAVGGNRNAAEVLKEVWHFVANVKEKEGRDWYALSREAIAKATGLSLDQVKRALAYLRGCGMITTEQHLFGGRNLNHFSVTEKGRTSILRAAEGDEIAPLKGGKAAPHGGCNNAPHEECNTAPPEWCSSAPLITTSTSASASASATSEPIGPQELPALPEKVSEEEEKMNMKEALKAGKEKTSKLILKPDSVAQLEHVWKTEVHEITGAMVGLKAKELGQLKLFRKLCPQGKAESVLREVLSDWTDFTAKVKSQAGVKVAPSAPSIGFLLQHAGIAVILATAAQSIAGPKVKPKEQEAPKASAVPKPQPVQLLSSDDDPPATYEELVALSKGL